MIILAGSLQPTDTQDDSNTYVGLELLAPQSLVSCVDLRVLLDDIYSNM